MANYKIEDAVNQWYYKTAICYPPPEYYYQTKKKEFSSKDANKLFSEYIKPKIMNISTMLKVFIDADTQSLVKAGYLDNQLGLTNEGHDALITILFVANKAALVSAANAKLAEEKK